MLQRNASKGRKAKSRQKHNQRLKDIAQADVSFIANLEETTNFMVPASGGRRKAAKAYQQKTDNSTTILSQVKKYGIEEMYQFNQRFVRTRDHVTDDPANYLPRTSQYSHSHIFPELSKEVLSKQTTTEGSKKRSQQLPLNIDKNIKISKLYHGSTTDINVGKAFESAKNGKREINIQHKVLLNIASTSKLDEQQHKQSGNDLLPSNDKLVNDIGQLNKENGDYPVASENKQRDSQRFTVGSGSEDPSHQVAKQIKEKAGSTDIRLNEDSDSSAENMEHPMGINSDTDRGLNIQSMNSNPSLVMGEQIAVESKDHDLIAVTDEQIQNATAPIKRVIVHQQNRYQSKNATQPKKLTSNENNPELQKILNHVSIENKRLWRLYDNTLEIKQKPQSDMDISNLNLKPGEKRRRLRQSQEKQRNNSNEQRSNESQEKVADFIKAVKNHTIYRRDNFVRNFANQAKQSLEPYLRFQVKEREDPFKTRPLSSSIKNADVMYPSRDAVARANQTDGVPKQPNRSFNSMRNQLKPGQTRPFSSHLNNMILLKQDEINKKSQRQGVLSHDKLARGRPQKQYAGDLKRSDVELQMAATETNQVFSTSQLSSDQKLMQNAAQHQRLLSYQLSQKQAAQQTTDLNKKQRPVSSLPYHPTNREKDDTRGVASSNDPHGKDDFVNVRQMLDPQLFDHSHQFQPPLTGKNTVNKASDTTDFQSAMFSNQLLPTGDILSEEDYQKQQKQRATQRVLTRPKSTPYSHLQQQATQASNESKSSQNLISQLRIKSVRQSKVRIVKDPSSKDHFDIVIDKRDQGERASWIPSRHTTSRVKQQDKVISNATNLHRATATTFQNTPNLLSTTNSRPNFTQTFTQRLSNQLERQLTTQQEEMIINEFPEHECEQLELAILEKYQVVEHMSDFLVYSETQSPIFIYHPMSAPASKVTRIFLRFKQCLRAGQLDQAMTMLDLGMKWKQHLHAFKFNAGVTYLLSQQYLEAVQTFRLLSKSFPSSPSVHSNLLFAYLCDGWTNNVKEFQSTPLFKSIRAPLTPQTKSILELIKYAFMSPDSIKFSKQKRSKSAADKFSSNNVVQQSRNTNVLTSDDRGEDALRFNLQSDVQEAQSGEEDAISDSSEERAKEQKIQFKDFKMHKRLKDFTQRTQIDPMNHMLREKLRLARHPELKYRAEQQHTYSSAGGTGRSKSLTNMPNYWDNYQKMLEEYHRKDKALQKEEMMHFQKVLDRIHKLCEDEEEFQTGPNPIVTHILKSQPCDAHDRSSVSPSRRSHSQNHKRGSQATMNTSSLNASTMNAIQGNKQESEQERKRREGDVNRILKKVKKIEEEQLNKEKENDDEESLDAIFKQLISKRATYISDSVEDPIEQSYMQLIDGLGIFHERYNVRNFIDQYLQMLQQIKNSEQIQQLQEAAGGFWKIESDIVDQKVSRKEVNEQFLDKFPVYDEQVGRARTFILDILFKLTEQEIEGMKDTFEDMAYYAEDRRRTLTMDPDRFTIEQPFILITRELIKIQQDLAMRIKLAKSVEVLNKLKDEKKQNQEYIDLIQKAKELTGRHEETVLTKTLEISKGDHQARNILAQQVSSPLNEKNLGMSQISQEKVLEYQELYTRGWEKQTYRPLPEDQKLELVKRISDEAEELLMSSYIRAQEDAIQKLKAQKRKSLIQESKLYAMMDRLQKKKEQQKTLEYKRQQRERIDKVQRAIIKKIQVKAHIEAALNDTQQFEFDLINAKLNLDAIEIKAQLAQCFSPEADLWEETAALKVIRQKIETINETIMNPKLLHDRDEAKLGPLQEKWFNATDQLVNRAKKDKALEHLSTALQDELKDSMAVDESKKHLQIRPKIGHEVDDNLIGYIEVTFKQWKDVPQQERLALDLLLSKNNRFFSIFDQQTRLAMYEHCTVQRHFGVDKEIDRDVEDTDNIQILLRGNIHIVQVNDELNIQLRLRSLRAGCVCGDESIQRKIRDPLKVLSKERKSAVTNTEETITIQIDKEFFMKAIFAEMQQELFYKIILIRNTPYFQELSPYSLTIMASNVEVREVKYGEVIIQQGQIPDAMYILAYGQCKTLYQYVEEKSTKVSKYANKCLKSDLPVPIHTGLTNYKTLPKDIYDRVKDKESTDDTNPADKELSSEKKSKASGENENHMANAQSKKNNEVIKRKLAKLGRNDISKRSFYHSILQHDKKNMTIKFQNHLVYSELKVGQAFGMRSLLDPLICKNHVLDNRQLFAKKMGINLEALWSELLKKQQLSLEQAQYRKIKRKEANRQATKFCEKCFQEDRRCDCLLKRLPEEERKLADKERLRDERRRLDDQESSFNLEFNDSHLVDDISLSSINDSSSIDGGRRGHQQNPGPSGIAKDNVQRQGQDGHGSKMNRDLDMDEEVKVQAPHEAYREQRDKVRDQIKELTKVRISEEKVTKVQKKKIDHKDRLQKKVEEEFSGRLYQQLMQAQHSIIVTSSTAKFLVIKKDDKNLLNEYLRLCIDKAILETNFMDLDRPENNQNDVMAVVQKSRGWTTFKENFMSQIMKESKMSKKANKLLDD